MVSQKKWFVFYTKSRSERKVASLLKKFGFECYLPLQQVIRQWSDRKKRLEVPLFNSYIFVKEIEANIPDILKVPGIAWNIRHNGKPAVLRDKELQTIKRFLTSGLLIDTLSAENLEVGDRVQVLDGPLRGEFGVLIRGDKDQKLTVVLESIDQALKVSIDKGLLKKIE